MEKKNLKHNNKAILSQQDPDVKLRSLSQRIVTAIPECNATIFSLVKKFMLFSFVLFYFWTSHLLKCMPYNVIKKNLGMGGMGV